MGQADSLEWHISRLLLIYNAAMLTAILSNPNSRHNQRHLAKVEKRLAEHADIIHLVTNDLAELDDALSSLTAKGLTLLGINGGDGTVQLALTALLNGHASRIPTLAVLPGGTTNMTALDINGTHTSYAQAMERFINAAHLNQMLRDPLSKNTDSLRNDYRRILRVSMPDQTPHYGMFFGMGAIISGIQYCHERIYRLGVRTEWAPGLAMLRAVYGIVRREPVFSDGVEIHLELDDVTRHSRASMLLVSTLDRLFLGIRPFWGEGDQPLKTTLVREKADRFLRAFPALLRGKPNRYLTPEAGFESFRLDSFNWQSPGNFTLDGEFYPGPTTTACLDTVGPLAFLNLGAEPEVIPAAQYRREVVDV